MKSQEKLYDIIRQKTTADSIPAQSASKAQAKTNRVFLISKLLVYNAITYRVVSVHPIIVEVINPIIESGPTFSIILVAIAIDPLPEIGRSKIKGNISFGILKNVKKGKRKFVSTSNMPDSFKIFIDKNKPKESRKNI